ncbi:DUF4974 domain-containing protein [Algoriphagus aestuariicola]|uniref:DUF4974 domain-containing protein n=1 Tax=Algoriphagus aestuariicola TaxID=1852016 RepID=A0ABS3BZL2_9BACT|nr:FecR domain-containing protein [Algoriphagus aestuariicola]MBN7803174.1 DUF4974 domain-containing protein [Algoriphagus aestuariicola]
MSKADYSVEDFILDPDFRAWILANDKEGRAYWENFLAEHPEKIADIKLARKLLIHLSKKKSGLASAAKEGMWLEISRQMSLEAQADKETKIVTLDSWSAIQQHNLAAEKKTKNAWRRKAAAILVLLGALGYLLARSITPEREESMPVVAETEVLQAPFGVKSTITLEDGSIVFLNSGSKITYTKGFTDTLRLLTLEGEAYFEVAHDPSRPFIVKTQSISTTALGTEFNVFSFPGEDISISLVKGEVLVNSDQAGLEQRLVPGQGVRASPESQDWERVDFDPDKVLSWMNKTLIFEKASFSKAGKKLEAWFGVELVFENSVPPSLHVSGKFVDESLENILKGLSYSSRFNYRIEGKKVYIQFNS